VFYTFACAEPGNIAAVPDSGQDSTRRARKTGWMEPSFGIMYFALRSDGSSHRSTEEWCCTSPRNQIRIPGLVTRALSPPVENRPRDGILDILSEDDPFWNVGLKWQM